MWAWGGNGAGQLGDGGQPSRDFPAQVPGFAGVVSIAAADQTSLAAKADGTVWQWGNFSGLLTNYFSPDQILGITNVTRVATAGAFSLALKADGTVWAWGENANGQLGDGTFVTSGKRRDPVQVQGLTGVVAIATGDAFGVALRSDGTVWQWGLLPGTTSSSQNTPVQIAGLSSATAIAAGSVHALALRADGTLWAWGTNSGGQLGDGTQSTTTTPVQVTALTGVTLIAAANTTGYARTSDGKLWGWGTWGASTYGFLGEGSLITAVTGGPAWIPTVSNPRAIAPGVFRGTNAGNIAVLLPSGSVQTWGRNSALGTGVSNATPQTVAGLSNVTETATGDFYVLARKGDGTVWAWGWNGNGQLGDGTQTQRARPRQVAGLTGVAHVSAGVAHSLALTSAGAVWAWGWNGNGQLGDGSNIDRWTPVQVPLLSNVIAVSGATSGAHSLALKSDGTVWAWGLNTYGQLGDGTLTDRNAPVQVKGPGGTGNLTGIVAIAAGWSHSLALGEDGTVWSWGRNHHGQLGDNSLIDRAVPMQAFTPPGITALAAGDIFSLAVKSDGTLWVWGYNGDGQLGGGITGDKLMPVPNTTLSGIAAAAAGFTHSAARRNDGNLWAWGRSGSGQVGYVDGFATTEHAMTTSGDFSAVAASGYHTVGVRSDGVVRVWGDNTYGELGYTQRDSFWIPAPVMLSPGGSAFNLGAAATRADFAGDGRSDVLWRNSSTGENYLYPMDGTSILASEGYLRTVADLNWQVAGTGDFDGDGKADILWRNSATGENYIYLMDGLTIKPTEGYIRTVADQNWQVKGVGDFDGDGKDDILWRNFATGENYVYFMDGLGIKPAEGYIRTVSDLNWHVEGAGDFDGDGKADILWRNWSTGENYLYPMNGLAIQAGEGYLRTVAPATGWAIGGIGDFDGDGKSDIFWRNGASGENYLYFMNGTSILPSEGYLRTVADQSWQVRGTGDYDGDGKSDLLWRNSSTGENYLYPLDGTTIKPTEGYLRTVPSASWAIQATR